MRAEYENVLDDHLGKIHFTYVNTWDELLPAHWHEHLEIIYVLGGEITASINDVSYELKKGDIFLVNSNDIHYTHTHEDARYYLLQIPPVHLERISAKWEGLKFQEFIRSKSADACVQGEQLENVQGKGLVEMRENRKSTNRADDLYDQLRDVFRKIAGFYEEKKKAIIFWCFLLFTVYFIFFIQKESGVRKIQKPLTALCETWSG